MADWVIDSPAALETVEAGAGQVFRETLSDYRIVAALGQYNSEPEGPDLLVWVITYFAPGDFAPMRAVVDAKSGQFLPQLSQIPEWLDNVPFAEMQTLTAREGYTQAEQAAKSWNPNAALVFVELDEETKHTVQQARRAPVWVYTFMDNSGTSGADGPAMLEVRVGPQGVISTRPG